VFNYTKFDTGMYGRDVVHKLLPLLRLNSSHSFLFGDWVHSERPQAGEFGRWLEGSPGAVGSMNLDLGHERYSPYYFAYLNNLTKADAARIDQGYIGMLDLDFDSPVRRSCRHAWSATSSSIERSSSRGTKTIEIRMRTATCRWLLAQGEGPRALRVTRRIYPQSTPRGRVRQKRLVGTGKRMSRNRSLYRHTGAAQTVRDPQTLTTAEL